MEWLWRTVHGEATSQRRTPHRKADLPPASAELPVENHTPLVPKIVPLNQEDGCSNSSEMQSGVTAGEGAALPVLGQPESMTSSGPHQDTFRSPSKNTHRWKEPRKGVPPTKAVKGFPYAGSKSRKVEDKTPGALKASRAPNPSLLPSPLSATASELAPTTQGATFLRTLASPLRWSQNKPFKGPETALLQTSPPGEVPLLEQVTHGAVESLPGLG